ncbi:MFS transporter [Streptomyces sp. NPDC059944]|uniref:MFS transporter n=1 Tax=unclassified Streptomyces TaxID=2593676 RepID=UPI00364C323D
MKTAARPPTTRTAPLRSAVFRRFVLANLISATGTAMAPIALAYAVIGEGGGAGSLGLVLATNTVPTVAFLLAGGVLADRMSRSRILVAGNVVAASAQGALAVVVLAGAASTLSIAACGFLSGVAMAFTVPAGQGVVNQLVAAEHLQQANALVRLPGNAVRVLGPVVGGLVVALCGPGWALAWDALTFVIAALLLHGLRLEPPSRCTAR